MSTLHIHIDESGDWNFSPAGSKYYVLAIAWTYDPAPLAQHLTGLRFALAKAGTGVEAFHAAPDKQAVRDQVVQSMMTHPGWWFASVVVEKRKVNPFIRDPQRFYLRFAGTLLRFVLKGRMRAGTSRILVFADTLPVSTRAKREGVLKAIKETCAAILPQRMPRQVYSHCGECNAWLQVVDYCCWAIQRKWERDDERMYDRLRPRLAARELNVTGRGDQTTYY